MRSSLASSLTLAAACCLTIAIPAQVAPDTVPKARPDASIPENERPKLLVGDSAPSLTIAEWVQGDPVAGFTHGRIYVVEFWATWCAPCRKSIPHLAELQRRFKDRLTVIGVSSHEGSEDVKRFVKGMDGRMDYIVALDKDGASDSAWMNQAGQHGIPTAFVVDGNGKIAWIGHPLDGLDGTIDRMIAGKFDLTTEAKRYTDRVDLNLKAAPLRTDFRRQLDQGDNEGAISTADRILAIDPVHFAEFAFAKYMILAVNLKSDDRAAKLGPQILKSSLHDNPMLLKRLAWEIASNSGIERRDLPLARSAAERAVEITNREDASALATLARVLFESGDPTQAVDLQSQAIAVETDKAALAELNRRLVEYRKKSKGP